MAEKTAQGKSRQADPRHLALDILCRVEQGAYADLTLDAVLRRHEGMDRRDRGLLTELVYGVLRCRGRIDFALAGHCRQPLPKVENKVLQILRLGAYQLLELERIPPSAAVDTSVRLAKGNGLLRASGFINGILRSLERGKAEIPWPDPGREPLRYLQHVGSLPPWLAECWLQQFGFEQARVLAEALLQPAPLTVRCNTLVTDRERMMMQLVVAGEEASACRFVPEGVELLRRQALELLPADSFQVQDEASMLVAHLLQPQPGERILDACAAPGGKTTHLAAMGRNQLDIEALELHPRRVELIREGAQRLGCEGINAREWDLTRAPDFFSAGSFDRILVDAPCSGLGVLRRNPEARWRRGSGDLQPLPDLQLTILDNVAPLLKPGGVLLYSVCTLAPDETDAVVIHFLERHSDYLLEDLRPLFPGWSELFDAQGRLATWPGQTGLDGFFAARFCRQGG